MHNHCDDVVNADFVVVKVNEIIKTDEGNSVMVTGNVQHNCQVVGTLELGLVASDDEVELLVPGFVLHIQYSSSNNKHTIH